MDFPYPVGKETNVSLPLIKDKIASVCFFFKHEIPRLFKELGINSIISYMNTCGVRTYLSPPEVGGLPERVSLWK